MYEFVLRVQIFVKFVSILKIVGPYMKALIGKKIGMTRIFVNNKVTPVTVIQIPKNKVIRIKKEAKDGYNALILGAGRKNKEFRVKEDELEQYQLDQVFDLDQFKVKDKVRIVGISKGKGFSGVIKRYHFSRGPETHGSNHHRAVGSIGSMFPQHVWKGKKMPGRMGHEQVTIEVKILEIDTEKKILAVKGAVPGNKKDFLVIEGK